VEGPGSPIGHTEARTRIAPLTRLLGAAALAACALPATAESITTFEFSLGGTDSLTRVMDSIVGSTMSTRFMRFRPDLGTVSKMASDVPPNTNLVGFGTYVWFTTRDAPYRIGRADLGTISGSPVYYATASSAYDDMALGADNSLWAANAQAGTVVRVAQSGATASYSGDGAMRPAGVARGTDGAMWIADAGSRRIARIDPDTGALAYFALPSASPQSVPVRVAVQPGSGTVWFATQDGFGSIDPATGAIELKVTGAQQPQRLAVAADGSLWMTDGTAFVTHFTPPSSVARLSVFANADAQSSGLYLDPDGGVYVSDPQNWQLAKISTAEATAAGDTFVIEYYNAGLGHYFITAEPLEAAAIVQGSAASGWMRTGQSWKGWLTGPVSGAAQVCRFYGSSEIDPATGARRGPNSHFYTLPPDLCAAVKAEAGWVYEPAGTFWKLPAASAGADGCPAGAQPVYRAYNNRYAENDSNHRYMVDPSLYASMIAAGWSGEGAVMCAPSGER
jgi:streptogramin lyase